MDEAHRRLQDGTVDDSRAVVITSDDGWRGFYHYASSALGARPATIYVTTAVMRGEVPWYVRWRLLLEQHPHLLRVLAYDVGRSEPFRDADSAEQHPHLLRMLAHDVGRSEPFRDADRAVAALKQLDYGRICALWDQAMKDVRLDETGLPEDWFMREEEVRDAAKSGFTIGAHTVHHPILTHEFEEIARREVTESKRDLEALTGLSVRHFAYPNGDHNEQVVRCVRESGYATAVTTKAGWNTAGSDVYRLRRFDVHETMCIDHRGRFSEALFALYLTGEWARVVRRFRLWT